MENNWNYNNLESPKAIARETRQTAAESDVLSGYLSWG